MKKSIKCFGFILVLFSMLFITDAVIADITIPSNLKVIDAETFYGNDSLDKVNLPEGLETVESKAFALSSVKAINFPDSINYIADDAFEGCNISSVSVKEGTYSFDYAVRHHMGIEFPPETPVIDYVDTIDTELFISWHRSKGATGYIIYYGTSKNISRAKSVTVGNVSFYRISHLKPNTKYYVWIRGINSFQKSKVSDRATATTGSRPNIESSSYYMIFLTEGESTTATFWMYKGSTIKYSSKDTDVATCRWGEWEGDKIVLTITGHNQGTDVIDIRSDLDYCETLYVHVYAELPDEPITGDISWMMRKSVENMNRQLSDKLRYLDEDVYTNDYFMVSLEWYDEIRYIALVTDAESDIGKYTLFGVYPGMPFEEAVDLFIEAGFAQGDFVMPPTYFYRSTDNMTIDVTVVEGKVDLVECRLSGLP